MSFSWLFSPCLSVFTHSFKNISASFLHRNIMSLLCSGHYWRLFSVPVTSLCHCIWHCRLFVCHVTVLYAAGARSNIRKAPSQPLWLTSCSGFRSMKTRSWTASGRRWRILLPVWATSLRAWRIWRWSRQIQAVVEGNVKKKTAAGEEKKWTRTHSKSPVLGPPTGPPAQAKAWTTSCSAAWILCQSSDCRRSSLVTYRSWRTCSVEHRDTSTGTWTMNQAGF